MTIDVSSGAKERIAVAAVDAAVVPHRIHRGVRLLDQQLVEAARPGGVGIAEEVARRRVVDEQRRVVHVAIDAPGIVLRHLPLAAAQRRQRVRTCRSRKRRSQTCSDEYITLSIAQNRLLALCSMPPLGLP